MLPVGSLMVEHRLIERMIKLLLKEMEKVGSTNRPDPDFILSAADFFSTYADRCHHGKEEDILFVELEGRNLDAGHSKILEELKSEHVTARENVLALRRAREGYLADVAGSAKEIHRILGVLTELYPGHIEKEDKHFFIETMDYFNKREQMDMIHRFQEFDEHLIYRIYRDIVELFERSE